MTVDQSKPTTPARGRFDARVEVNQRVCRDHYRLRLRVVLPDGATGPGFPPTRPGQFVQLGCRPPLGPDGDGDADADLIGRQHQWQPGSQPALHQPELRAASALLRRPFSLSGRGDDAEGTWLELVHRVVGTGTQWLAKLNVGDPVDLLGPLGNTFDLPPDKTLGLLVGGGVGLPPMFYLAEALRRASWDAVAFVGALTADLLAVGFEPAVEPDRQGGPTHSISEFSQLGFPAVVSTDDGSLGLAGRVTAGLARYLDSQSIAEANRTVIFTCGPNPMMRAVAALAAVHDVPCQVCLEQAMACGMGTCQSCIVKIRDDQSPQGTTEQGVPWRYRLTCTDGPVFCATSVVW